MGPGLRVVSREISQGLGGCLVVEASQPGVIVVVDEVEEIGVSFGMIDKAPVVGGPVLRQAAKMLAEAAVEAFDHAVGLRVEGLGEAMGDAMPLAELVEEVMARGFVLGFARLIDGEAVGELGAVVGEDGVDLEREALEKA